MANTVDQVMKVAEKIRQVSLGSKQSKGPSIPTREKTPRLTDDETESPPAKLDTSRHSGTWERQASRSDRKRQRAPRFQRQQADADSGTRSPPPRVTPPPRRPGTITYRASRRRVSDLSPNPAGYRRAFGKRSRPGGGTIRYQTSRTYARRQEHRDDSDTRRPTDRRSSRYYYEDDEDEDGPWRSNWRSRIPERRQHYEFSSRRAPSRSLERERDYRDRRAQEYIEVEPKRDHSDTMAAVMKRAEVEVKIAPSAAANQRYVTDQPAQPELQTTPQVLLGNVELHTPVPLHCGTQVPLLYVDHNGIISVMLRQSVIVELTVDKTIRLLVANQFSAAANVRATRACVMHPKGRISQDQDFVYAHLGADKLAAIGPTGVVVTMKNTRYAYLVSSSRNGCSRYDACSLFFPSLQSDFTLDLIKHAVESQKSAATAVCQCNEIVQGAKYTQTAEELVVEIYGISIKQDVKGDVEIHASPRHFSASPTERAIQLRTNFVDMEVLKDKCAHVKRGVKRVHVSHSGMVVSDGVKSIALDFDGNVVSQH